MKSTSSSNNVLYAGVIIVFLAIGGLLVYNAWALCDEDDILCRNRPPCVDGAGNAIDCPSPSPEGCAEGFIEVNGRCVEPEGPPKQNPDLGWRMAVCNYSMTYQSQSQKGEYGMQVDNCSLVPVDQDTICREPVSPIEGGVAPYGPQTYRLWVVGYDGPYNPDNLDLSLLQGYISRPVERSGIQHPMKTCVLDNVSMCEGVLWESRCARPEGHNEEVWEISMILVCIKDVNVRIAESWLEEHCAPKDTHQREARVEWEEKVFSNPISYKSFRLR